MTQGRCVIGDIGWASGPSLYVDVAINSLMLKNSVIMAPSLKSSLPHPLVSLSFKQATFSTKDRHSPDVQTPYNTNLFLRSLQTWQSKTVITPDGHQNRRFCADTEMYESVMSVLSMVINTRQLLLFVVCCSVSGRLGVSRHCALVCWSV